MKNQIGIKNKYDIKANQIEKAFFKNVKSGIFFTGKGNGNEIKKVTDKTINFTTQTGSSVNSISRAKLKKAISFMLFRRTATRKDLEKYTNYNSALMGLLRLILIDIARISKTVSGLLRITIRGIRHFFSGMDRPSDIDFNCVVNNNGNYILNSFYYLRQKKNIGEWIQKLKRNSLTLLVDSGAFTIYNQKVKGHYVDDITVEEYADFINTYKDCIHAYINLDVIGNAAESKANFNRLIELTGISPIPVWHVNVDDWKDSDWNGLEQIVNQDQELIALGGTVVLGKKAGPKNQNKVKRELFKEVFRRHPNQNFHLLGSSSNLLFEFPFFSADSSGWLQGRKKNQIYTFESESTSTRVSENWSPIECLSYNVRVLSSLEDMYNGIQVDFDMLVSS